MADYKVGTALSHDLDFRILTDQSVIQGLFWTVCEEYSNLGKHIDATHLIQSNRLKILAPIYELFHGDSSLLV